ncbi:Tn3 family transposase (plasmid) [Providencia rettgeri]|nr:Tn3 family transposase [Providencia rettgeri]
MHHNAESIFCPFFKCFLSFRIFQRFRHETPRQAVFEYDRLVRSIYTLKHLRDPQLEQNIHRSQNRIESYHQLL